MKKIAILASGSGSNAEKIIAHFHENERAEVAVVITNNPNAGVLERARLNNIPAMVFSKDAFEDGTVLKELREVGADLIVLAGFLLKIPQDIIEAYPDRIVNIHPALLPSHGGKGMYGKHVHEAVVARGDRETGITMHYVNDRYDEGRIIAQYRIPLSGSESALEVAARVLELEHRHYPATIEKVLDGL